MASVGHQSLLPLTFLSPASTSYRAVMPSLPYKHMAMPLTSHRYQPQPRFTNQGYLPNGANSGPTPGAAALLPNNGRVIQSGPVRVLCVADVRGEES